MHRKQGKMVRKFTAARSSDGTKLTDQIDSYSNTVQKNIYLM
jgi:hypothetical protein